MECPPRSCRPEEYLSFPAPSSPHTPTGEYTACFHPQSHGVTDNAESSPTTHDVITICALQAEVKRQSIHRVRWTVRLLSHRTRRRVPFHILKRPEHPSLGMPFDAPTLLYSTQDRVARPDLSSRLIHFSVSSSLFYSRAPDVEPSQTPERRGAVTLALPSC
jgi:hypothetical protein